MAKPGEPPSPSSTETPARPPAAVVAELPTLPPSVPGDALTLPPSPAISDSETLAPTRTAAATATGASVPGYEIIRELGRGGMGVVYQARQIKLGRIVALKMILSGAHAGAAELVRFRTESEAVARLQHPNIVQIFEVGDHDGLPYFSLEFCGGGSLEKKLSGTPLPAREAAALVATLARAMQAAHEQHVIHRDLKPANVLLAEDGTPKVTDFGLAKKLDEADQTASGAVMGTPSYMAPEQACGKSGEVGPLADVYALGAILYECLTGRPPFKAATALDTIMQVATDEPVPPMQLQPKTPRDVETICLKCLQKEPAKRYASAAALADDLRRFQDGEPIAARPAGVVERARKWAKRRPAAAALLIVSGLATLTVVGVVGSATALIYAKNRELLETNLELIDERNRAKTAEEDAHAKATEAVVAKTGLEQANGELRQSRDRLELSVARSLLRPLGLQEARFGGSAPLTDPEIDAVWELAGTGEATLRLRFVAEAIKSAVTIRQLKNRAPFAIHAAVGLDARRRAEIEALLMERLATAGMPEAERVDLALALSALGGLSRPSASRAAATLTEAIATTKDPFALPTLSQGLSAVAGYMEPDEGCAACAKAAARLTQAMSSTELTFAVTGLQQSLSALAGRLSPKDAAQAAETISRAMRAMSTTKNLNAVLPLQGFSECLSALAGRLDPEDAVRIAAALTQTISVTRDANGLNAYGLSSLSRALSAVAARMGPAGAAAACAPAAAALAQAMKTTEDAATLRWLSEGMSALAGQMEPDKAMAACTQAAAKLTQAMSATEDANDLQSLSLGLAAVSARMDPAKAEVACAQAATRLTQGISTVKGADPVKDAFVMHRLSEGLSIVAARVAPAKKAELCDQAAARLAQAMSTTMDEHALQPLSESLAALAAHQAPEKAKEVSAQAAARLTEVMSRTQGAVAMLGLCRALLIVAAHLTPEEAEAASAQAAAKFSQLPGSSQLAHEMRVALELPAVARREPEKAAATVIHLMSASTFGGMNKRGLLEVLTEVEPPEQSRRAAVLMTTLGGPADGHGPLFCLAFMQPAFEPLPCRLSTQQLVELLKNPFCVGEARRVTLDQLGNRYHRSFGDVWEFVRFAREQNLDLDFATPPQRPEPAAAHRSSTRYGQ